MSPSKKSVSFPVLPKALMAPAGEVTVVLSPKIKHPDGDECWVARCAHGHWLSFYIERSKAV